MTDLGFGLADKRSVLIVLFTFVLSSLFFGNPIPLDTSTVDKLFVSLVILTGFIYFARTTCRIILDTTYAAVLLPIDIFQILSSKNEYPPLDNGIGFTNDFKSSEFQGGILRKLLNASLASISYRLIRPLFENVEGIWQWSLRFSYRYISKQAGRYDPTFQLLGIFDRLILIAIAFIATLPAFSPLRDYLGLIGIILLMVVYIFSKSFNFILSDEFHRAEEDHERLVDAARNPNVSKSNNTSNQL